MRYIIIYKEEAFYSVWFSTENNYAEGMIVIDTFLNKVTFNGSEWNEIEFNNL